MSACYIILLQTKEEGAAMRVWSTHRPISIGTYPREYGVEEIHNYA